MSDFVSAKYFEFSIYLLAEAKTEAIFTCGNKMKTFYFAWKIITEKFYTTYGNLTAGLYCLHEIIVQRKSQSISNAAFLMETVIQNYRGTYLILCKIFHV